MLGLSDLTEEKITLKMGAVGAQAWLRGKIKAQLECLK